MTGTTLSGCPRTAKLGGMDIPPDKDIERQALLEEARADWQWSRRAAEGWRQHLVEIVLVVEEASLEEERLRAQYFFLLEEEECELEKPDPM